MNKFRARIYSRYVDACIGSPVPASVSEFASRAPALLHVIRSFFPPDKASAIVDIGCGYGALIYFALREGYHNITGVDVSEQQIALAHRLGIERVQCSDLMEMLKSAQRATFDAVVSFDVIEHFAKDELVDFVDAVHEALKPGGRWIIHAPNAASPFFGAIRYGDFTHEQAFTPSSIRQLLSASGFSRFEFAECAPISHGMTSLIRSVLWRGVRHFWRLLWAIETGDPAWSLIITRNFYVIAYKSDLRDPRAGATS